jgi:hypothetical protein
MHRTVANSSGCDAPRRKAALRERILVTDPQTRYGFATSG